MSFVHSLTITYNARFTSNVVLRFHMSLFNMSLFNMSFVRSLTITYNARFTSNVALRFYLFRKV